jgi:glycosyltransferase involved in cell wall biosynthesis
MKLLVISHKEVWRIDSSKGEYVTTGGFPYQMKALAHLFNSTRLLTTIRSTPPPAGLQPLAGHNLYVTPLPEPAGADLRRKLALLFWLPRHFLFIWRAIEEADAVHTPVPGDLGVIGILLSLIQRKPLFVRHCGTWGRADTAADHFLHWLLQRIAGGRNVVLATGGGDALPSTRNPSIQWIFSSSLSEAEWRDLPKAEPWQTDTPLRLIFVGRLTRAKNVQSAIGALPLLVAEGLDVILDVIGDGEAKADLQRQCVSLELSDRVNFHGNVTHTHVLELLASAHVFVFPTRSREGFPKAVLEAMACGLPVVTTAVSVLPSLLGAHSGVILEDTQPASVAKAVLWLTADAARMADMGRNARQTARAYTLDRWRDEIGMALHKAWGQPLYTTDGVQGQ